MKSQALIVLLSLVFSAGTSFAEKMDIKAHNTVISKLESSLLLKDQDEVKKPELLKRLGDLYSERARLVFIKKMDGDCKDCPSVKTDRVKALKFYNNVYSKLSGQPRLDVELQRAELNLLLDNKKASIEAYKSMLSYTRKVKNKSYEGVALYGLGEVYYMQGNFKVAQEYFKKAKYKVPSSLKPMAYYRLAWSLMNSGKKSEAIREIKKILSTSSLLVKDGEQNKPFHDDVSRDLVVFLAQRGIKPSDINTVKNLSPRDRVIANLYQLGDEAERTGQFKAAIMVWESYLDLEKNDGKRLEVNLRNAQNYYNLGQKKYAKESYKKALLTWVKTDCEDICSELKIRFKNFVVLWQKDVKEKKDLYFYNTLKSYLAVFKKDANIYFVAGTEATKHKKWKDAVTYFESAAKNTIDKQKDLRKASLMEMVGAAESSKNRSIKRYAYKSYLNLEKSDKKRYDVDYQLVHLDYEEKNYKPASEGFLRIANNKSTPRKIRLKSADLALDSLVLLKQDDRVEKTALTLAKDFKERKIEFTKIARDACLNIAVSHLKSKNMKSLNKDAKCLSSYSIRDLKDKEKISYLITQIEIFTLLGQFDQMESTAKKLLRVKGIRTADRDYAYNKIVFVAELQLRFSEAYRTYLKISNSKVSRADRELKAGMLAELAGKNSRKHYLMFIKYTPSLSRANEIRAYLAIQSKRPWKELKSFHHRLRRTPEIYANAVLEVFSKNKNRRELNRVLKTGAINRTTKGAILHRYLFLREATQFKSSIEKQSVRNINNRILVKTINRFKAKLSDGEKLVKKSIRLDDPLAQAYILSVLDVQYKRFIQTAIEKSIPVGIKKAEKEQFIRVLTKTMKATIQRQKEIHNKVDDLWGMRDEYGTIASTYEKSSVRQRQFIAQQFDIMNGQAPVRLKRYVNFKLAKYNQDKPESLRASWKLVKKEPFNFDFLSQLKASLDYLNEYTLSSYVELRRLSLKGVKK